jgi:glucose-1-phosphate adenylyltransferase
MGIYIFSWKVLKEALVELQHQNSCDFGKHVIPYLHERDSRMYAYEFNGYWKDVGTLSSYWEANMELIDLIPEFNLYEKYWKVYTNTGAIQPQYISAASVVDRSIIGEGSEIYGEVHSSVIGANVVIGKGSVVRDSIIMQGAVIGENVVLDKAIIADDCQIGNRVRIGVGDYAESKFNPKVYNSDLAVVGEGSVIPDGVSIGKNTAIAGETVAEDYVNGLLESGDSIIKAGVKA